MATNSDNGTESKVLRKFGINETYQLAMYLLDQYRGTVLSCRYVIPPSLVMAESRTQLEESINIAVVDTVMRHPMMQVGMINHTSKIPSWIQLPSLDLKQHIKWHYIEDNDDLDDTIQDTIRHHLDEYFPDLTIKQPGWKLTMIRQGYTSIMEVLLTFNHPHFDGAGARVFHEDLLEMLNISQVRSSKRTDLAGDIFTLPDEAPLLPTPIEDLRSLPVDLKFLIKGFWEDVRPQFLNRDVSLAAWCPIRPGPYKTQYRAFFLDKASLTTILALCRQNKTTITGLLNGLALIAFSSQLDSKTAPAFQSSTIIDHRRNLPPAPPNAPWRSPDRAMANYVTQLIHTYDTRLAARVRSKLSADRSEGKDLSAELQNELWTVSAQSRQEIVHKLESGLQNDLVGLFKWVTDWKKTMSEMVKKKRQFTWLVTNLGVLNGNATISADTTTAQPLASNNTNSDDNQRWSIERAQFSLSAETHAAVIEIASVGVIGGGMCVSANWSDCSVDVMLADRIMADIERWLQQLGR